MGYRELHCMGFQPITAYDMRVLACEELKQS
jgi:hypothetical protein